MANGTVDEVAGRMTMYRFYRFLDGPGCAFIAIGMVVVVAILVLAYVFGPALLTALGF
jgi:hypothetical protein